MIREQKQTCLVNLLNLHSKTLKDTSGNNFNFSIVHFDKFGNYNIGGYDRHDIY